MRHFKPFGSFFRVKVHASKDGKKTLCGHNIESSWEEVKDWKMWYLCKRCQRMSFRVMDKGRQLSFKEN